MAKFQLVFFLFVCFFAVVFCWLKNFLRVLLWLIWLMTAGSQAEIESLIPLPALQIPPAASNFQSASVPAWKSAGAKINTSAGNTATAKYKGLREPSTQRGYAAVSSAFQQGMCLATTAHTATTYRRYILPLHTAATLPRMPLHSTP